MSGSALQHRFGKEAKDIHDPHVWEEAGMWLGMAIANTTALLDPHIIIIGGGLTMHWKEIEPSLRATMEHLIHIQPLPLLAIESLAEEQALLGAQRCLEIART